MRQTLFIFCLCAILFTGGAAMAFDLRSSAFDDEGFIPRQYTGNGEDFSPPLSWVDVPAGTESFALFCTDPDSPSGDWVHWVIYDIPPRDRGLAERVPNVEVLPNETKQGYNSSKVIGYQGPRPPKDSIHRYVFTLYALDVDLDLAPGMTKQQVQKAMAGHILDRAELTGRYKRVWYEYSD